jgi:Family of unknown function (DUF5906)/Bifunctional DNA primase/polymerase, N-terminal
MMDGIDIDGTTTATASAPAAKAQLDQLRIALHRAGYHPLPIHSHDQPVIKAGKRPAMRQWQKPVTDEAEIARWSDQGGWRLAANTGLLCGDIVGIDIDVPDAALAAEIRAIVERVLGPTPLTRFGAVPKFLSVYRVETTASAVNHKIATPELFMPDGRKVQVEGLAQGQQFVSHGVHPDTRRGYRWETASPLDVPMRDLPVVTFDQLLDLRADAEKLLRGKGGLTKQERAGTGTKKKKADGRTSGVGVAAAADNGKDFFVAVNREALDKIGAWAPAIFPTGHIETGTGAFRVSSTDLGRALEEDLSIHPVHGAYDFGEDTSCSPIDIVIRHGAEASVTDRVDAITGKPDALTAALWLCERLGIDPVTLGYRQERPEVAALIAEFNEKHFVTSEGGATLVMTERHDSRLNRTCYTRSRFRDIEQLHSNRLIKVDEKDGTAIMVPAGKLWLNHRKRRSYLGGVVFDPAGGERDDQFNLWRGFSIKPKPGNWSLMSRHMLEVICGGNIDHCLYLRGLMARMVQQPWELGEVAVVLCAPEGAGKGVFIDTLMELFAPHALQVSNSQHLVGKFNEHLRDCLLLFADEAFFAGDRAHVGVLKALITEKNLIVEPKGFPAFPVPNRLHIFMASNNDWVVPADLASRRWFVPNVSPIRLGDRAYFNALCRQMEHEGGLAAMLHDLLHDDLADFDHRDIPKTEGLNEQRKLSLPIPERWWLDVLSREFVLASKHGFTNHFGQWHEELAKTVLFESYRDFSREHRDRDQLTREDLGRFIIKMGGSNVRLPTKSVIGESRQGLEHHPSDRPWGYRLGTLKEARDAFTKRTGLTVTWDD